MFTNSPDQIPTTSSSDSSYPSTLSNLAPESKRSPFIYLIPLILIIIITASLVISFYFQSQSPETTSPPTLPQITPQPTPDFSLNWDTYTSPDNSFTFKHPQGLTVSSLSSPDKTIRLSYMGPTQTTSGRTQTSLFDGYQLTISQLPDSTDAQIHAQNRLIDETKMILDTTNTISELEPVTINSYTGFQYYGTWYGDHTLTVLTTATGNVYEISRMYTSQEYKITVDQIISTLKFTDIVTTDR